MANARTATVSLAARAASGGLAMISGPLACRTGNQAPGRDATAVVLTYSLLLANALGQFPVANDNDVASLWPRERRVTAVGREPTQTAIVPTVRGPRVMSPRFARSKLGCDRNDRRGESE